MSTVEMTSWISAVSIATASIVGLINLIVMGGLTAALRQQSRDVAAHDVLRRNSEQWQALNLAFIQQPRLQALLDGDGAATADEARTGRNIVFYILNILHDLHMARQSALISEGLAAALMNGQLRVLKAHAPEVRAILAASTGYAPTFSSTLSDALTE